MRRPFIPPPPIIQRRVAAHVVQPGTRPGPVVVAPPPKPIEFPRVPGPHHVSGKEARERSRQYWEFLDQYELAWGHSWFDASRRGGSGGSTLTRDDFIALYGHDPRERVRSYEEIKRSRRECREIWEWVSKHGKGK